MTRNILIALAALSVSFTACGAYDTDANVNETGQAVTVEPASSMRSPLNSLTVPRAHSSRSSSRAKSTALRKP